MFQKRPIQLTAAAATAALALFAGACNDEISSPSEDGETIENYLASVTYEGTPGTLRERGVPRPRSGDPELSVDGHLTIVNGGTATLTVSSSTPFETIYVAGSAPISGLFVPISGYFEVPMPEPTTTANLLFTFPQTLPAGDFGLYFSAMEPGGEVGPVAELAFQALTVGTGDVQVTCSWNTDADVDLHVVDPTGREIYWADRSSPSGGELDLDSNAACAGDNVRNENITWAAGTAPAGTYLVRVDYWSSCDASETAYTVLIHNDDVSEIYRGTFRGGGDNGGIGSGVLIDTFTRTHGPPAMPMARSAQADLPAGPTVK